MVRLLHFSDLHLGAESYGRFDPETGLSSRLGDFLDALDRLIDFALQNDIHAVLFAGDVYKSCDPSPTHQREFAQRIGKLGRAGIPTVLLAGNHDTPSTRGRANSIEIFEALQAENVHTINAPKVLRIETRAGPVQVAGLPWFSRSSLMAREDQRGKSLAELEQTIIDWLEQAVAMMVEELDGKSPAVLMTHGSVFGAVYSSERKTILGGEPVLPLSMCINPAFDYVALGHIHKYQVLNEKHPLIVYSGSVERIDFGEEKEDKGWVVAEVSRGEATHRFVPSGARSFITVRVECLAGDPMDAIREALDGKNVADAVVRVILSTTPELEALIDDKELRRLLKGAFHVAGVVRDVKHPNRMRLGSDAIEALKPRELLERYFQYRQLPPDRVDVLLAAADQLMQEDGVDSP